MAQLIEDRTKSIEKKIATDIEGLAVMVQQNMASKEFVREIVGEVLEVVKTLMKRSEISKSVGPVPLSRPTLSCVLMPWSGI